MTQQTRDLFTVVIPVLAGVLFAGCAGPRVEPRLGDIYTEAARYHDAHRNPVIVIPGILGSRLVDQGSGRVAWGAFNGNYANPERADGARLAAIPMRREASLAKLQDGLVSDGALDRVSISLLGLPVSLDAYRQILLTLGAGAYRDEALGESGAIDYGGDHYTCFQFDYDWRRDNVENARRLHEFIVAKREYVAAEFRKRYADEHLDIKFDIVAHSMGGLIARYFMRYGKADLPKDNHTPQPTWAGAEFVERVILVGTPNAGSVDALQYLVQGRRFAPTLPKYASALLGTMPSVYQLLPRSRHRLVRWADDGEPIEDLLDVELWKRMGWGLADPDQDRLLRQILPDVDASERRAIALDHQEKCLDRARRFFAALDVPAQPPTGVELVLFAGDAVPTGAVVEVGRDSGELKVVEMWPGDHTVLRASALMDERLDGDWTPSLRSPIAWDQVTFLFSDHLGMTKDPAFSDNVLFKLLERQHRGTVR